MESDFKLMAALPLSEQVFRAEKIFHRLGQCGSRANLMKPGARSGATYALSIRYENGMYFTILLRVRRCLHDVSTATTGIVSALVALFHLITLYDQAFTH